MGKSAVQPLKYQRVRETLRQRIVTGTYQPGSKLPTESELPEQLQSSKITVVRALNDLVKEGLIVRRRGKGSFVAETSLRPILPGRKLRIGVLFPHSVIPHLYNRYFEYQILHGILAAWGVSHVPPVWPRQVDGAPATRATFSMPAYALEIVALGESIYDRPRHPPLSVLADESFDAFISLAIVDENFIEQLLALKKPVVLADFSSRRFIERTDQVFFDPVSGYGDAVRYYAAQGLKRIHCMGCWIHKKGVLSGEQTCYDESDALPDPDSFIRISACQQAMAECGLPAMENWPRFAWSESSQVRPIVESLAALPPDQRPEAIICHAYNQAECAISVFAERGLRLRAAGSLGRGTDAGIAHPIWADGRAMGQAAAALLTWKLQQPQRPVFRVGVPMIFGDSSAAQQSESAVAGRTVEVSR